MLESLNRRNSIDSNQGDNDNDNDNHSNDELSPSELYYSPSGLPPKSQLLLRKSSSPSSYSPIKSDLPNIYNHLRSNDSESPPQPSPKQQSSLSSSSSNLPQLRIFLKNYYELINHQIILMNQDQLY